jgi:hypothetical protein
MATRRLSYLLCALALLLGCYASGTRVMLSRRAESEVNPERYGRLVLLDLDYRGELELGEITARRLREALGEIGDFEILPENRLQRALEEIGDFDPLDVDQLIRLGELTGAELVVTGEMTFSRYGSLDYSERLAESYDVTEDDSPSMLFGRSEEATQRQNEETYVLSVTLRGYDAATGDQVWKKTGDVQTSRELRSRTPPGRSELMSIYTNLVNELVREIRDGLQTHLVEEFRYIIP